jgi:hypothetical protein
VSENKIEFIPSKLPNTSITKLGGIDTYTKLMLHMEDVNTAVHFLDSETTPKAVTAAGNAQIVTAQYKFGTSCGLFDGTGDYLTTPDHANWNFAAADFTIDFWIRFNALPTAGQVMVLQSQKTDVTTYGVFGVQNVAGVYYWSLTVVSANTIIAQVFVQAAAALATATWYHIAFVRSSNSWYVFQDGVQCGSTYTSAGTYPDATGSLYIGSQNAIYTAKAMTAGGNAKHVTAQSNFGGACAYFDGAGDYISTPDSDDFYFNANFTIDFWYRYTGSLAANGRYVVYKQYATANDHMQLWILASAGGLPTALWLFGNVGGGAWANNAFSFINTLAADTWCHLALARSGNNIYCFKDGVQQGATYVTASFPPNIAATVYIGQAGDSGSVDLLGWLDEYRVSKAIARWTGGVSGTSYFTPSTIEYPVDTYTKLLLHMNGPNNGTTFIDGFNPVEFNGWLDEYRISTGAARWAAAFTAPDAPYVSNTLYDLGAVSGLKKYWINYSDYL